MQICPFCLKQFKTNNTETCPFELFKAGVDLGLLDEAADHQRMVKRDYPQFLDYSSQWLENYEQFKAETQ